MSFFCEKYPIIEKKTLAAGIYSFTVKAPEVAKNAACGQFANIGAEGFTLRRPISICDFDEQSGTVRFVFEERGEGTAALARLREGECLDILAPLGNGFKLPESGKVVVIGGGIGAPPMLKTAKTAKSCTAILGFRDKTRVILEEEFKKACEKTVVCTDDGSYGIHGVVTEPLKGEIKDAALVCACGPSPMIKAVAAFCETENVPCQVSLEQRMGCGVGACVVCSCMTVRDGKEHYARVCKDGPVFDAKEVRL